MTKLLKLEGDYSARLDVGARSLHNDLCQLLINYGAEISPKTPDRGYIEIGEDVHAFKVYSLCVKGLENIPYLHEEFIHKLAQELITDKPRVIVFRCHYNIHRDYIEDIYTAYTRLLVLNREAHADWSRV